MCKTYYIHTSILPFLAFYFFILNKMVFCINLTDIQGLKDILYIARFISSIVYLLDMKWSVIKAPTL